MGHQLRLVLGLYVRPLRALSGIMDEGSIVFGAMAVLLVAGLFEVGTWARYWGEITRATAPVQAAAPPPLDPDADPDGPAARVAPDRRRSWARSPPHRP